MAKKGRVGRRGLKKRIQSLENRVVGKRLSEATTAQIVRTNLAQSMEISRLEREVSKALDKAKSITDMVGGFKLFLMKPDELASYRFNRWRLQVEIQPEAYIMAFDRGGGYDFRDFTHYAELIGRDVGSKVAKMLKENADKMIGSVR